MTLIEEKIKSAPTFLKTNSERELHPMRHRLVPLKNYNHSPIIAKAHIGRSWD